jgi:hypothetical protein
MAADGPIDIQHGPIHAAMTLYGIEDRRDCFEKVLYMAGHHISEMRLKCR